MKNLEKKLDDISTPMTVSIIGCVVNGPGEATMTDIGITGGGNGTHMIYLNGKKNNVVKNVDQRVSNIRARRRSATLEKAQEFLNNPVAVTYAFTVNENDFSPASSSSLSGSNLSFASSTESIQDDSEEEVEETLISLTEEVDNNMKINNNSSILITGGTGSFGKNFVHQLLVAT